MKGVRHLKRLCATRIIPVLIAAVMLIMGLASCSYDLLSGESSAASSESVSSGAFSVEYPPERPDYNSEVSFEDISSDITVSDVLAEVGEGSSSEAVSSQSVSSSKAVSSQAASSKPAASSSKAASSKPVSSQTTTTTKAPAGELRAVWVSYLDLETMLKGKSSSGAQSAINAAFDKVAGLSMNAVIVQVRPFADALYSSDYFPWSRILTGTQGQGPGYDPLGLMVDAAHSRGLDIHVWINPYRVLTSTSYDKLSAGHIAREWKDEGNDYTVTVDSAGIFFNPARQEVRDYIIDGVAEIVENYDIDGVHYDDYFYPTTAASFDRTAYSEYTAGGGSKSLANWRMENVNKLIKGTYSAIKAIDSSVQFGVSPNGNIDINYSSLYADVKTWCQSAGYIDYIMPQLYYGFDNETCPYEATLKRWNSMITADVSLYTGLAVYKIGVNDQWAGKGATEWQNNSDILMREVNSARKASKYEGFALYRYDSVFNPSTSVKARVNEELGNLEAIL